MNNKVIYTANIGGYDEVIEPDYIPDGWDLICFTDKDLKSENWKIHKVLPLYEDDTRTARKYKLFHAINTWYVRVILNTNRI